MKNLFLSTFKSLISQGVKNTLAMSFAWKLAKLQGNCSVCYLTVNNEIKFEHNSGGIYSFYVSKAGIVIVSYKKTDNQYRSFRLDNLLGFRN